MTTIHAPAGVVSAGIGMHVVSFLDGTAEDPGLNAGERAHWQGLGYKFVDDEDGEKSHETSTAKTSTRKRPAKAKADPVDETPDEPETAEADAPAGE